MTERAGGLPEVTDGTKRKTHRLGPSFWPNGPSVHPLRACKRCGRMWSTVANVNPEELRCDA